MTTEQCRGQEGAEWCKGDLIKLLGAWCTNKTGWGSVAACPEEVGGVSKVKRGWHKWMGNESHGRNNSYLPGLQSQIMGRCSPGESSVKLEVLHEMPRAAEFATWSLVLNKTQRNRKRESNPLPPSALTEASLTSRASTVLLTTNPSGSCSWWPWASCANRKGPPQPCPSLTPM